MKYLIHLLTLLLLSACYEPIDEEKSKDEDKNGTSCQLQITVFSSSRITYPVNLLIFNKEGNRIKDCTLTQDKETTSLNLKRGNYRIVALSGTSYYKLPSSFTLDSQISLSGDYLPLQALYMGEADVTLASDTALANLQLIPQTTEISVKNTGLSSLTKQVKVQLSSLYTKINLQASYEAPELFSLSCEKNNNIWQAGPYHLFPGQGTNTIISLEVIRTDSTLNYGYILPYPLQAGYKYELETSPKGIAANDTLIDTNVIQGTFNEDTLLISTLPSIPDIWDGHIVIYKEMQEENKADLWLLSINEWEDIHSANSEEYSTEATEIASSYQEGGSQSGRIAQWHIPTKEEVSTLRSLYAGVSLSTLNKLLSNYNLPIVSLTDENGDNQRYLCNDALHTFSFAASSTSITKGGTKATYHMRLLKKVHVKVQK